MLTADFTYEDHESLDAPAPWRGWGVEMQGLIEAGHGTPHPWTLTSRWLSGLSLRLQSGQTPGAYHAANLALHLLNGLLLYVLTRRYGALVALTAVALWWLHPLQVDAVASVSARTDLLMTTGILLTLLVAQLPGWTGVLLASGCALLAMAAKETGVVVLGLLPLWRWQTKARWSAEWLTWLAIVGSCGVVLAGHTLATRWGSTAPAPRSAFWYAAVQCAAAWRLLALVVWPVGFTVDHDVDLIGHTVALVALTGSLALVALAWAKRQMWPAVSVGVGWVALALGPRIVVTQGEFLNEHQFYLPFAGVCLALARTGVRDRC